MRLNRIQAIVVGLISGLVLLQPSVMAADALWSAQWQKFPQNPVVTSSTSLNSPCVICDGGTYKMWLTTDAAGSNIKYCTSLDGTTWTSPITVIANESFATWEPWVIKDGSIYKMWYRVHNGAGSPGDSWINYATSTDGVSWNRHGTVLVHGNPGDPDYRGATRPVVLQDGGLYHMWYTASAGSSWCTIAYATSPDGVSWTKHGTVFAGDGSGFDATNVPLLGIYREGEYYYLLYAGWVDSGWQLGMARSQTGTSDWERKDNPIISPGGTDDFDGAGLGVFNGASILEVGGEYWLWYPGRASGGPYAGRTSIGLAIGTPANQPPVARARGVEKPADESGLATVFAAEVDNGSYDPDGDDISLSLGPVGPYPFGTTAVTLTVTDSKGASSQAAAMITVIDQTPPTITGPASITVEAQSAAGVPASYPAVMEFLQAVSATDNCDSSPTVNHDAPDIFPLGETIITFTASDASSNVSTFETTVAVVDTTAPTITNVSASPNVLWPPNHHMVEVTVWVDAQDLCDSAPASKIIEVTCNESVNGPGDGNTEPDWWIVDDLTVMLRAERSGSKKGRIYTMHLQCTDASGNSAAATVDVTVPHDQGKKK